MIRTRISVLILGALVLPLALFGQEPQQKRDATVATQAAASAPKAKAQAFAIDPNALATVQKKQPTASFKVIDIATKAGTDLKTEAMKSFADQFVVGRLAEGPQRVDEPPKTKSAGAPSSDRLQKALENILQNQRFLAPSAAEKSTLREVPGLGGADLPQKKYQAATWTLPWVLASAEGTTLNLQPIIVVDAGGLRPGSGGAFWGRIFAGVLDIDRPNESHPLSSSITFLITADIDRVDPQRVTFQRTNQFEQVDLAADSPPDPVVLRVVPTFDPRGTSIKLPVRRGTMNVTVSPQRIQGLGLEEARVIVQALGVPEPEHLAVVLSSDRGSVDPGTLVLDAGGVGSTTIRSVTTGTATLHATSVSSLAPGQAAVTFLFPWLFLGAALLGGATGGAIRRARTEPAKRRTLWMDLLVLGVLGGLVVACAYSVGINLLGVHPDTHAGEALIFVLAALGALFGVPQPGSGKPQEPAEPAAADDGAG